MFTISPLRNKPNKWKRNGITQDFINKTQISALNLISSAENVAPL